MMKHFTEWTLFDISTELSQEQEMLLNELRTAGFFDVFELTAAGAGAGAGAGGAACWGCFLCTRPERALGFLAADGQPVIEGQLKEKKGRWRLFRRWRTRYFTLSGAHLSCKGSVSLFPELASLAPVMFRPQFCFIDRSLRFTEY